MRCVQIYEWARDPWYKEKEKEKERLIRRQSLVRPIVKLQCLRIKFIWNLPSVPSLPSSRRDSILLCHAWVRDAKKTTAVHKTLVNANIITVIASTVLPRLSRRRSIMENGRRTLCGQISVNSHRNHCKTRVAKERRKNNITHIDIPSVGLKSATCSYY